MSNENSSNVDTILSNVLNTGITWYITRAATLHLFIEMLTYIKTHYANSDGWQKKFKEKYNGWDDLVSVLEDLLKIHDNGDLKFGDDNIDQFIEWLTTPPFRSDNNTALIPKNNIYPNPGLPDFKEETFSKFEGYFLKKITSTLSKHKLNSFDETHLKDWETRLISDVCVLEPRYNHEENLEKVANLVEKQPFDTPVMTPNKSVYHCLLNARNILKKNMETDVSGYIQALETNSSFTPSVRFSGTYNLLNTYILKLKNLCSKEYLNLAAVIIRLNMFGIEYQLDKFKNLTLENYTTQVSTWILQEPFLIDVYNLFFPVKPDRITFAKQTIDAKVFLFFLDMLIHKQIKTNVFL